MRKDYKESNIVQTDEDVPKKRRFVVTLLFLVGTIVIVLALSIIAVSHFFFEHTSCRIAERTVDAAWIHARTIAVGIRDNAQRANSRVSVIVTQNPDQIRRQIIILIKEDPTILYGGVVSLDGKVLIHTDESQEGTRSKLDGVIVPEISPRIRALPEGRPGFPEYVYEIRVPIAPSTTNSFELILGMSKQRIDAHITRVNRNVRARIAIVGVIGAAILLLPSAALWRLLRSHAAVKRRAEAVAHMAQIGQLASGLAHEIRNPLNAVRFNLKILEEGAQRLGEDAAGYGKVAKRAAEEVTRVDGLLAEYLDFAKPHRRRKELQNLGDLVKEVVRFFEHECQRHDITVVLKLSDERASVPMDRHRMKQAVLNLLLNAKKELQDTGGSISITSSVEKDCVLLSVADEGSGVPTENLHRIFEPFWTDREDGVGLGLAITRQIIEEHEGAISCKVAEQGGAEFTISLPYARTEKDNA